MENPRVIHGKPDDELPPIDETPPFTEIERHPAVESKKKARSYEALENEIAQLRTELREHINPSPKKKVEDVDKKKWSTKKKILVFIAMCVVAYIFYNFYLVFAKGYTF